VAQVSVGKREFSPLQNVHAAFSVTLSFPGIWRNIKCSCNENNACPGFNKLWWQYWSRKIMAVIHGNKIVETYLVIINNYQDNANMKHFTVIHVCKTLFGKVTFV
jgi:hypothetical protein